MEIQEQMQDLPTPILIHKSIISKYQSCISPLLMIYIKPQ